ncbi:helix-turn-helix domain-containing protein [Flavobacterium psychrophilum]|uniref:Helix-turn-helix domain-containing protein n=1 Tax=Flavobacterium psychrophilum TaxID=96345 RepID=A0A7U2NG50_FLAPS|nr:helix-turn-helix domain-containing protein [Flavobacterium psychrophilum]QRE04395.1 helix-turn-helix domain-containing protein [Flavobacterium psychrophilum]
METIQITQTTANDFKTEILKGVKIQIDELKSQFQPKEPNEYLTRQEVATMFNVDLSTIHNWCKSKKLNPLGLGARVYFLRSEIEASLTPLNV